MRAFATPVALILAAAVLSGQQATFKSGTSIVPVHDYGPRLRRAGSFPILNKTSSRFSTTQAAADHVLPERDATVHGGRDARLQREHDPRTFESAEAGDGAVRPADAAAGQGTGWRVQRQIQFSGKFTNNRDELIGDLKDLQFGNPTRLYDAIDASIDVLKSVEGRKSRARLSPTATTPRASATSGDALARARETEDDGLRDRSRIGDPRSDPAASSAPGRIAALKKLAEETGGGYFELKKTAELAPTFTRVAAELHSLYNLGFTPRCSTTKSTSSK
jgi:hypothetical protein